MGALDYRSAKERFSVFNEGDDDIVDVDSGLAGVLQLLGEADDDVETLREAVELFRTVMEQSSVKTGREVDAGPLSNTAGALISLAKKAASEEASALLSEARRVAEEAYQVYARERNAAKVEETGEMLVEIDRIASEAQTGGG